jgi:hypothetical protein
MAINSMMSFHVREFMQSVDQKETRGELKTYCLRKGKKGRPRENKLK